VLGAKKCPNDAAYQEECRTNSFGFGDDI
jgi:hypothetical protein